MTSKPADKHHMQRRIRKRDWAVVAHPLVPADVDLIPVHTLCLTKIGADEPNGLPTTNVHSLNETAAVTERIARRNTSAFKHIRIQAHPYSSEDAMPNWRATVRRVGV